MFFDIISMKRNRFILILLSLFVLLGNQKGFASQSPINRHYIIVVDQTIKNSNANMGVVYSNLCRWFRGENVEGLNMEASTIPKGQKFDVKNDAISLFTFGLPGDGQKMNSTYGQIHRDCYNHIKNPEQIFTEISSSLIHVCNRYVDGQCILYFDQSRVSQSFDDFLHGSLRGMFNGTDRLHTAISQNSGITMSHFVYPLIMDFVSKTESANEYYLILVSDFKSGLYSNNDQDDWNTLSHLTAGRHDVRTFFERQINIMKAPFVQADFLHFQSGDIGAKGTRIMHKSVVLKSQLYLTSSLSLSQADGDKFNLSKAVISFDRDNLTSIDSIGIIVSESGKVLCSKIIAKGPDAVKKIEKENREYEIPAIDNLDLSKSSLGDITVKYVFYTMSHDEDGNNILPVSLMSQQVISKDNITYVNEQLRKNMIIISVILVALDIVLLLCWLGRKKNISVDISRFAQKYIDVTNDKGAVELPCWFYAKGADAAKLRVSGKVTKLHSIAVGGSKKLYVRLQENKPEGFGYWVNGRRADDFVPIETTADGSFVFNLDISVDTATVNVHELSLCSVMLDFKVDTSFFGILKNTDVGIGATVFDFYFIEDLGRAWVGFDPGTSGSCMAVGNPNGALNDPNIEMVTVKSGTGNVNIIPSKLVFNKTLTEEVHTLTPGIDYQYGVEAEINWGASRNMPRFQSIKKLLGYKKSETDKIVIPTNGAPLRLSGVDIAHLLVKGLNSDLVSYLKGLSPKEHERIVGDQDMPQRAVVAIPNNYTLPKIQDMVESVRRLGTFKEIRYIYEAEGILFNYLRKTFKGKHPAAENIMVYDMGGATINLTVFQVRYVNKNNSTYYYISTLGRIGYAVGGDNIDVALMEHVFKMGNMPEQERHEYQMKHKSDILFQILRLKRNLIYANRTYGKTRDRFALDVIYDADLFGNKWATQLMERQLNLAKYTDDETFVDKILHDMLNSKEVEHFVYSKVEDAVAEIMKYPEVAKLAKVDKLIFAGRSTMFPNIKKTVTDTLEKCASTKNINILSTLFDDSEIKTSVAYGACWYGIYNGLVSLDNSRLSSAYGFKQTTGSDSKLNILLNQNSLFDEDNKVSCTADVQSNFDGDGQTVAFYQVMGSGTGDNLLSESNRYKVNYLTSIPVTQTTKSVSIEVGKNNTATCSVTFDTGITVSKSDVDIQTRDIAEENDWAYIFATTDKEDVTEAQTESQENLRRNINNQPKNKDNGVKLRF